MIGRGAVTSQLRRTGVNKVKQKTQKGFTLIELLVVIAIIGLLASVVLLALGSARQKARDAKRVADVRQIQSALELFYNDNNRYPTATASAPTPADGTPAFSTFMATYPDYPLPTADGTLCGSQAATYTYAQTGGGTGYTVAFCLGGQTGGLDAGPKTASQAGIS